MYFGKASVLTKSLFTIYSFRYTERHFDFSEIVLFSRCSILSKKLAKSHSEASSMILYSNFFKKRKEKKEKHVVPEPGRIDILTIKYLVLFRWSTCEVLS